MHYHPLLRAFPCSFAIVLCSYSLQAEEPKALRTVTVAECLRRVTEQSLDLKSGIYKTEAAQWRARQAARPINPRLETEIENVAGSGDVERFDAAETTVTVSQEIELQSSPTARIASIKTIGPECGSSEDGSGYGLSGGFIRTQACGILREATRRLQW